jgi:hypothetical protein
MDPFSRDVFSPCSWQRFAVTKVGGRADASQPASHIVLETGRVVKKPPTVFIVEDRPEIANLIETTLKEQFFWVECYPSAVQFIADQELNHVGCVLVDPLFGIQGDAVLRWLHNSKSPLSIVLISGLINSPNSGPKGDAAPPAALSTHAVSALLTMVTDGLAGSLTRQVIRERSR